MGDRNELWDANRKRAAHTQDRLTGLRSKAVHGLTKFGREAVAIDRPRAIARLQLGCLGLRAVANAAETTDRVELKLDTRTDHAGCACLWWYCTSSHAQTGFKCMASGMPATCRERPHLPASWKVVKRDDLEAHSSERFSCRRPWFTRAHFFRLEDVTVTSIQLEQRVVQLGGTRGKSRATGREPRMESGRAELCRCVEALT
eukprot:187716-Prymnesium_polylepis.2